MRNILLSGGSGKRLWPLSNDARSKQFLKILTNQFNERESMVQRVWRQLANVGLQSHALIATGRSQVEILLSQLGDQAPLVIEPERRDTFPAIALAASYLYSEQQVSLDEAISVLPVDPFVDDSFFEHVKEMEKMLNESDANLGLIGIQPDHPSEKYGYIIADSESSDKDYRKVFRFTEKPDSATALTLIEEGALWNGGVFAFKLRFLIELMIDRGVPIDYNELLRSYHTLNKISFDYEVVEKAEKIVVLPYRGKWKDLGTWNALTEEMDEPVFGKGTIGINCTNTHIVNELDLPVTVLGLSDVVVAVSPDGILVSDKEASPQVKEVMKNHDLRPMYEERLWGWYRVLDFAKQDNGQEILTRRIGIRAGRSLSYHEHHYRDEIWTILSGEGEVIVDGERIAVKAGEVVKFPCKVKHSAKALVDMELIEVQLGEQLTEEDSVRYIYKWEDIMALIAK